MARLTLACVWGIVVACLALPAVADCPPNAPQNLTASQGNSCIGIDLDWSNVGAADYYEVWRNTTNNYQNAIRVSPPGLPLNSNFTDNTALPFITYHYWVTAYQIDILCGIGNHRSNPSNRATGFVGGTPDVPTGVGASSSTLCGAVYITWNAAAGAANYDVYRASAGGTFAQSTFNGTSVNTDWTDTLAVVGNQYRYWVKARNLCGTSAQSSGADGEPGGAPNAPTGVSASASTLCGAVYVSWNPVANATNYDVYRADAGGSFAQSTFNGTSINTDWTDTLAVVGNQYRYWVKARNLCGTSGESGFDTGQPGGPPAMPTGVSASDSTNCVGVDITWNPVGGANSYHVWRTPEDGSQNLTEIGLTTSATSWTDLTAVPGRDYLYSVQARNLCGISSLNNQDHGRAGGLPDAPAIIQAIWDPGTLLIPAAIDVVWEPVAGATHYEVWRSTTTERADGLSLGISLNANYSENSTGCSRLYYWVRAHGLCGDSGWSESHEYNRYNVIASETCNNVDISWNVLGVFPSVPYHFVVQRDGIVIDNYVPSATNQYLDYDAVPGHDYTYRICAMPDNPADGCIGCSNDAVARRNGTVQPMGVSASDGTRCADVLITWTASPGATLYRVYRNSVELGTTTDVTWQDVPPVLGQVYTYAVRAESPPCSPSAQSLNTGSAGATPQPPAGVSATDGTRCADVRITWTAAPGATGYEISRDGGVVGTIGAATAFNDTTAVPGQVYAYTVRASSVCGTSAPSTPNDGHRPGPFSIAQHPLPQPLSPCDDAQFAITTSGGGPLTFQWRRDDVPIANGPGGSSPGGGTVSGATTAALFITDPAASDQGGYSCMVTDACGNEASTAAALSICFADFDCSHTLAVADIFAMLNAWFAGSPGADFDGTNGLQVADIFAFLNAWFAGCP